MAVDLRPADLDGAGVGVVQRDRRLDAVDSGSTRDEREVVGLDLVAGGDLLVGVAVPDVDVHDRWVAQRHEVAAVMTDVEREGDVTALDESVERRRPRDAVDPKRCLGPDEAGRATVLGDDHERMAFGKRCERRVPLRELVDVGGDVREVDHHALAQNGAGEGVVLAQPVALTTGQQTKPAHPDAAGAAQSRLRANGHRHRASTRAGADMARSVR